MSNPMRTNNQTPATTTPTTTTPTTPSTTTTSTSPCLRWTACCTASRHATKAHVTAIRSHIRWINNYAGITVLVFILVTAVTQALDAKTAMYGCNVPTLRGAISYSILLGVLIAIDGTFVVWMTISKITDSFSINTELKLLLLAKLIFVVPYIGFDYFTLDCNAFFLAPSKTPLTATEVWLLQSQSAVENSDSVTSCVWIPLSYWSLCFWVIAAYMTSIVWPLWQSLLAGERTLRREYGAHHHIARGKSAQMFFSLKSLLQHKNGRDAFLNFLRGEYSMENLLFYEACEKFTAHLPEWNGGGGGSEGEFYVRNPSLAPVDKYTAANKIYEKFIQPDKAPFEINLPSRIQKPLIDLFEGRGNDKPGSRLMLEIEDDVFRKAMENIFHLMETDAFSRFKKSSSAVELDRRNHKKIAWRNSMIESNMA